MVNKLRILATSLSRIAQEPGILATTLPRIAQVPGILATTLPRMTKRGQGWCFFSGWEGSLFAVEVF
ncbi:hypothetical protein JTE90_020945 [Oedothorax gibbosus]|uniref:Uncharacterized protein n=1 Tax=Oedothorax gibbosus TaxID=931172 RepID=A0AAV6VQK4_9ARAC|nr:hypothetical protein JTE90_020945 [Oedothorax gibbosus]